MAQPQPTEAVMDPPPGVTPDFDNPERRYDTTAYVLSSVGIAICTLCVAMRIYAKGWVKRAFGIEDICIILAWIFSLLTQGIMIYSFADAGEGMHLWEMRLPMFTVYQKVIMAASVTYVPCLGFAKLSLLFLYHRLSPQRRFRIIVYVVMVVVGGYSFALIFILIFACRPIQMGWDAAITDGECVNRPVVYIATAVVNIATDLSILIIPIPMVVKLKMPRQQKLGLICMFIIGSATVITSIVRLITLLPMLTNPDGSWAVATPAVWIIVEANLVIICGCLPAVRQFLRSVAPRLIGENTSSSAYPHNNSLTAQNSHSYRDDSKPRYTHWTDRYGKLSLSTLSQTHNDGRKRLPDDGADLIEMDGRPLGMKGSIMRTTETSVVSQVGHLDRRDLYAPEKMWGGATLKDGSDDDDGSEKEIIDRNLKHGVVGRAV